jgi:cytochrome c biogenesis protein CcmG/thiol:disulfide interchange protein DsbE
MLAAIAAIVIAGGDDDSSGTVEADAVPVEVSGDPLAPFEGPDDPAIGQPFPAVSGTGLDGEPLAITSEGAKLVVYVAHWCPHCQREVPVIQEWVDRGNLPDDVELAGVSTAIHPNRDNYPPSDWFEEEGWTATTLIDPDDAAAQAAGLSVFPFFVAVNEDGTVAQRGSGELTEAQLTALVESIADG